MTKNLTKTITLMMLLMLTLSIGRGYVDAVRAEQGPSETMEQAKQRHTEQRRPKQRHQMQIELAKARAAEDARNAANKARKIFTNINNLLNLDKKKTDATVIDLVKKGNRIAVLAKAMADEAEKQETAALAQFKASEVKSYLGQLKKLEKQAKLALKKSPEKKKRKMAIIRAEGLAEEARLAEKKAIEAFQKSNQLGIEVAKYRKEAYQWTRELYKNKRGERDRDVVRNTEEVQRHHKLLSEAGEKRWAAVQVAKRKAKEAQAAAKAGNVEVAQAARDDVEKQMILLTAFREDAELNEELARWAFQSLKDRVEVLRRRPGDQPTRIMLIPKLMSR